jgi:tRNA (guanine9-N1)-methyltransferase
LTADSETLVDTLDPSKTYIIGGIVDHNRHKLLTFNKAQKEGLKTGRLPIRESGVTLTTSAVLTVNHVFDIIARYHSAEEALLGSARWKKALEEAIPGRKIKEDKAVTEEEPPIDEEEKGNE